MCENVDFTPSNPFSRIPAVISCEATEDDDGYRDKKRHCERALAAPLLSRNQRYNENPGRQKGS